MAKYKSHVVEVEALTFDELIQFGLDDGANVQNGMPWSFMWKDHPITHETDELYLVPRIVGIGDLKIGPSDILLDLNGVAHVMDRELFGAIFQLPE